MIVARSATAREADGQSLILVPLKGSISYIRMHRALSVGKENVYG